MTGPSTLAAFVNSLQMGFRTLPLKPTQAKYTMCLEQSNRICEIRRAPWKVAQATEHRRNTIGGDGESIQRRLRAMERALKDVEALDSPSSDIVNLLED